MGHKLFKWSCAVITKNFKTISMEQEKQRLAELLDLLLNDSSLPKIELAPVKFDIPTYGMSRPKKRGDL